jgi:hypothetical protein
MSTIIKKRTLKEISNATEYSQNSFVAAKQFIHDERDVTPEQILMKNLAVLFPEIEEKVFGLF